MTTMTPEREYNLHLLAESVRFSFQQIGVVARRVGLPLTPAGQRELDEAKKRFHRACMAQDRTVDRYNHS